MVGRDRFVRPPSRARRPETASAACTTSTSMAPRLPRAYCLTEKAGKRPRGIKAIPPTHAKGGYWRDYAGLDGISCASAGNCGAVGDYYDNHGHKQLTLLTQKSRQMGDGRQSGPPRRCHFPSADAISCASPQSCTVVGSYAARGWVYHGLLLTEVHGGWAKGVKAPRAGYVSVHARRPETAAL